MHEEINLVQDLVSYRIKAKLEKSRNEKLKNGLTFFD